MALPSPIGEGLGVGKGCGWGSEGVLIIFITVTK